MFEPAPIPEYNVGIAKLSDIATLTGRQQIDGIIDESLPAPSMARAMTHWIHATKEGEVEFRGEPSADVLNPAGIVHGGWAMTLLDSALGCAIQTTLAPGEFFVSLDTSVRFLKPITHDTGQVRCIGTVRSRGKRVATAEGVIEDTKGRVLATGTTACFIQRMG